MGTKITLHSGLYLGHLSHRAGAVLIGLEILLPDLITPETTPSAALKHKGCYYYLLLSAKR